jgi:putative ABC transport system ATP-binding protein
MNEEKLMIELEGIGKIYPRPGGAQVRALSGISLRIERGEFVAVVGSSGSGKSTLLNVLGLLDRPSEGRYVLDDEDVSMAPSDEQARIRNARIGFVFQAFRLLPWASALENVELPLHYSERARLDGLALAALESVGLAERVHHRPAELSGGQQQRVAIARALVNGPDLLLADEPTGNLDARSALEVMAIFQDLNRAGRTIVLVTHDAQLAAHCRRIARVEQGRVVADDPIYTPKDAVEALRSLPAVSAAEEAP